MATYSNKHWLLSHIRNSFISTDDTGMCETVMVSDDLPKHFLRKHQEEASTTSSQQQRKSSDGNNGNNGNKSRSQTPPPLEKQQARNLDPPLIESDFICYPGLDQSDDEDMDLSTQSFDIQMYPEVGAHRFRSNTAQKLEKMDIARRKAARTKCVNFDDEIIPPERSDFFVKKSLVSIAAPSTIVTSVKDDVDDDDDDDVDDIKSNVRSKLTQQLANSPKQAQNKFMEFARFDGTSQTGIQTKRINVYLSMLPERERNYPIKICVLASAKIIEVIGLVCYKATIQYPDMPLKSIRHYGLYMTEDNDDLEDFPPLDNREPCSKFGFSHLTLAERRPLVHVTRLDYHNNPATKSIASEDDKSRFAAAAIRPLQTIDPNGSLDDDISNRVGSLIIDEHFNNYEERMISHNDMLEAPLFRTYRVSIIDKRFFKTEIVLGVSSERIEIDQHKNAKFWSKQKAVTYPMESLAHCEIIERRQFKAVIRIWLKSSSSSTSSGIGSDYKSNTLTMGSTSSASASGGQAQSPTSPGHFVPTTSPFAFLTGSNSSFNHHHTRFKHYDFEADQHTAEQILKKLNCILEMRSSEVRREFLRTHERKSEKSHTKKQLKL